MDLRLNLRAYREEAFGLCELTEAPQEQVEAKGIQRSQQGSEKDIERRQREVAGIHYAGHG